MWLTLVDQNKFLPCFMVKFTILSDRTFAKLVVSPDKLRFDCTSFTVYLVTSIFDCMF